MGRANHFRTITKGKCISETSSDWSTVDWKHYAPRFRRESNDQDPSFMTLTFCGQLSAVRSLYAFGVPILKTCLLIINLAFICESWKAIQARVFHTEFTFESSLDLTVASLLFACEHPQTVLIQAEA